MTMVVHRPIPERGPGEQVRGGSTAPPAPANPLRRLKCVRAPGWAARLRPLLLGGMLAVALSVVLWRAAGLGRELGGAPLEAAWLAPMVALTTLYFALKTLRWQYYLRVSGVRVAWPRAAASYLAGQWFTFTPAGELVRGYLLQRYGVPLRDSAPAVAVQALMDLAALALVAACILPWWQTFAPLVLPIALPVLGVTLLLALPAPRGWLRRSSLLTRTPLGQSAAVQALLDHADTLLHVRPLLVGLAIGVAVVLVGASILGAAGLALGTAGWGARPALLVYATAMLLGGLSFLPHGLGLTDAGGATLLVLLDLPLWQAVAVMALFRLCTLGWGAALGGGALLYLRLDYGEPEGRAGP